MAQRTDDRAGDSLHIPDAGLVVLVGASGAGKTTLARELFAGHEVLSSDAFREMVSGDPASGEATVDAFEVLSDVVRRRLARRLVCVVDSTALHSAARTALINLARDAYLPATAVVVEAPLEVLIARNQERGYPMRTGAVRAQFDSVQYLYKSLPKDGFQKIWKVPFGQAPTSVTRNPLPTDFRDRTGPFDIVGDVHGCLDELVELLGKLGYHLEGEGIERVARHPDGRTLVFVGDLADRGPASDQTLALAMNSVRAGTALWSVGNHDDKLMRALKGGNLKVANGLETTLSDLAPHGEAFRDALASAIDALPSHLWLDGGKLCVAHAGIRTKMVGRASKAVRSFCLFGDNTGEVDGFGMPVRGDWASTYEGTAHVVWGHVAALDVRRGPNSSGIDTGCVFGGSLTAMRWPEREFVSVPARRAYYDSGTRFGSAAAIGDGVAAPATVAAPAAEATPAAPGLLLPEVSSLLSKRGVDNRFGRNVMISAEQSAGAFEALARFGIDPRWLVYIPPQTATVDAAPDGDLLERPEEAFAAFSAAGENRVIVEEKHMGSRAVAVVCRDLAAAARRFADDGRLGVIYSRTGRAMLNTPEEEAAVIARLRDACTRSGLWERLASDWVVLDMEMTPWSMRGEGLIQGTFLAASSAARLDSRLSWDAVAAVAAQGRVGTDELLRDVMALRGEAEGLDSALRPFTAPSTLQDMRLHPFQIMAAEGRTFHDQPHSWHLRFADHLAEASDGLVRPTWSMQVNLAAAVDLVQARSCWDNFVDGGGEGFVVKALNPWPDSRHAPSAVKVRGPEYLRIVYGADYRQPERLEALRRRDTRRKRGIARSGTQLALEGLCLLVEGAETRRVHALVAASLAVASEAVDARL